MFPTRALQPLTIVNRLESHRKHAFASYCWDSLVSIIPEILQSGRYAEELCGVATTVFRSLNDSYRRDLDLAKYIGDWCSLLLQHRHDEVTLFYNDFSKIPLTMG